ncbi:MAG: helix-turn-helix domain-containing protein [Planctomycetes bacterium]|nr:helix-turn-helix domain-containing protein [Planctomycetota bacterium]
MVAVDQEYVTPKDAAKRLSVSVKTVYKLAAAGKFEVLHVGRAVRILRVSLLEYIASNTAPRAEAPPPVEKPVTPHPKRRGAGGFVFLPPRS